MKILIVVPEIHRLGGVANHYLGLSPHWKIGVDYLFYGKRNDGMSRFVTILLYPIDYCRFIIKLLFNRYDAVIINPSLRRAQIIRDGLFLLLAKLFRTEVVTFIHGFDVNYADRLVSHGFWFRWTYNKSSFIYTLASDFRNRLIRAGISCPILLTTTKVSDNLIEGITIPERKRINTILFSARIIPEKGIFITLETFAKLKGMYPELRLFVCGDGPALQEAKSIVADSGLHDVFFFGKLSGDTLRDKYLESDIYILPTSWPEGMATTVLEAMAFGLPVVTRPVGGVTDFWEGGKMGYLIDSFDPDDYVSVISEMINSPEMVMSISSYNNKYAVENFLASKVVMKFENDLRQYIRNS